MFYKSKLATAVSGALYVMVATGVQAQQAETVEKIEVRGVRGSLSQSMNVKRQSTGVVDAISAEDMGKFPDTNLAESLQRITGVSINRVNGEGSEVTVRGFGGNFNLITLNGRQMPAANVASITGNPLDQGASGTTRSFDFSNLASEGVSGIEVYKTGRAAVPSGGIGATMEGLGNFLFDIVSLPINTAVNFVKDLFGFGNPDEPFSLLDFFLGDDGPVMSAFNWFKSLFTIDFGAIKQKLFDMGKLFKGLAMGGVAAAKAILPGGESPGEAFKRVFDSYTKGNEVTTDVESGTEIAKIASEDVQGNVTEQTYKTNTINNAGNNSAVTIINNDQSTKQVANSNYAKTETYTGSLNVSIDPYFDRYNYNGVA